jgi:hypothetical protein
MKETPSKEYVHEGKLVAEVEVTLIEDEHAWAPYFSIEDVRKLEMVREALRRGDLSAASRLARVYELKPIAAE